MDYDSYNKNNDEDKLFIHQKFKDINELDDINDSKFIDKIMVHRNFNKLYTFNAHTNQMFLTYDTSHTSDLKRIISILKD